jgi:excisionase family DNA binding protein
VIEQEKIMPKITIPNENSIYVPLVLAAKTLGLGAQTLRRLVAEGQFTKHRPTGVGRGRTVMLRRDEINAYAASGVDGLKEFRAKQGRK